jgi:hypothetical protein
MVGLIFFGVQISPRFYLLSSQPVFHSHVEMFSGTLPNDAVSNGILHCDGHAVLSFDKRFAVQEKILFPAPFFASPFRDRRPLLMILYPDKITHCPLLIQGEELRGPPTA